MISKGVFEEHKGPTEWLFNPVIVPKDDGELRITVDYRSLSKSLLNTNAPIPSITDLQASMNGSSYYTKLDLNQAFFQFEIFDESKKRTTIHANGKLMRLNRLPQGVLPASSELNEALQQIMSHIPQAHVIHDDILIATSTLEEQYAAIGNVFQTLSGNVLTLKGSRCLFALKDIPFWGMRITSDGIKPCPEKCRASQEISPNQKRRYSFIPCNVTITFNLPSSLLKINCKYQKPPKERYQIYMN